MSNFAKSALAVAKQIQDEVPKRGTPPAEGLAPESEQVLAHSLVKGTKGYIEKIAHQINGAYEHGWFDACAVMIRRLIETLIIETFEKYGLEHKVQNQNGDFLYLKDLINATLNEPAWNLGRNTKRALPRLKDVGDQSAHSRRFVAHRSDIDNIKTDLRIVIQELTYIAGLK